MSSRERKEQAKREKKKRAEERHRQKVLDEKLNTPNGHDISDDEEGVVVTKAISMLQI